MEEPIMTALRSAGAQPVPTVAVRRGETVPRSSDRYLSLEDFDAAARRHLPRMLYGFIAGGAETNASVRANSKSFQDYYFIPRVLADVSTRSHRKTLFGRSYAAPFGIAPMGAGSICAYRSDIVMARRPRANPVDTAAVKRSTSLCKNMLAISVARSAARASPPHRSMASWTSISAWADGSNSTVSEAGLGM